MRKRLVLMDPPENGWRFTRPIRTWIVLVGIMLSLAGAIVALMLTDDAYSGTDPDAGFAYRCFPAKQWGAEDSYRPCVVVKRVEEDGSFKVAVYDADGDKARYTMGVGVPDAYECKIGVKGAC